MNEPTHTDQQYTSGAQEDLEEKLLQFEGLAPHFTAAIKMHQWVGQAYCNVAKDPKHIVNYPGQEEELADILLDGLKISDQDRRVISRASMITVEDFYPYRNKYSEDEPALMANKIHYLVEHNLHVPMVIAHVAAKKNKTASVVDLVTAVFHDYLEDLMQLARNPRAITEQLCDAGGKEYVIPCLLGMERLTIRQKETYTQGIEKIFVDFEKEGVMGKLTKYLISNYDFKHQWYIDNDLSRDVARKVKLADKISAVQTIAPFTEEKKLRLFGKALYVLNTEREYAKKNSSDELTSLLSQVLAYEMRKSLKNEMQKIEQYLPDLTTNPEQTRALLAHNQIGADTYVTEKGGLQYFEIPRTGFIEGAFGGTLYRLLVLGLPLSTGIHIPEALKRVDEQDEEARLRLIGEKEIFRCELPNSKLEDLNYRINDETTYSYVRAHQRFSVLFLAAGKYADQSDFYLPLGGI